MQRKITNIHLRISMRRGIIKEEVPYDLLPDTYKKAYTRFYLFRSPEVVYICEMLEMCV